MVYNLLDRISDCLQRRWELRSDHHDEGDFASRRKSCLEAASHLQIVLRDRCGVLSLRRANVFYEVRLVDLRRILGEFIEGGIP